MKLARKLVTNICLDPENNDAVGNAAKRCAGGPATMEMLISTGKLASVKATKKLNG